MKFLNSFSRPGASLRARFIVGLGAVLLPFFAAAALGVFYLLPALVSPLESIVYNVAEEMEPVRHLQVALLTAAVEARDLSAGKVRAVPQMARLTGEVDAAFDAVRASPSFDAGERALIEAAWRQWQQGRPQLLTVAAGMPIRFEAERAAEVLDGVYAPARLELERSRAAAQVAKRRSLWATLAAFLLALGISVFASATLAASMVRDIDGLRQGALRLAKGELSHRVAPSRAAELSDLGAAFNAMAERIEKDQAALAELATRDPLTGLLNRRELLRRLREELDRSRRYERPCALLLLDIDRFKSVNDTWGHPAGDAVLRALAGTVLDSVRASDHVGRYGGEEFAVLLPETGAEGALTLAERVRAAIAATPIAVSSERSIAVTASIGVALRPGDAADVESLVACADRALYRAKQNGRNAVVAFSQLT